MKTTIVTLALALTSVDAAGLRMQTGLSKTDARLINALAVKYDCHDASGNLVQTINNVIAKNEERGHALTTECANLVEGYANEWSASTDTFSTETTKVIPEEKAKQASTDTDAETAFKNVEDVWCTSGFHQRFVDTTNVDEAIDETSARSLSQVSACAALGSVADTCELHLKHVDSAIKTVDTDTNYACDALGSTIQDVTSRKANADGAYAIADKHFEEESKLYTDGQERVARNIAFKNLFTKCFLTKDALDECNVEEETTYSKEFSKGRAGVVQETAETAADEVHAEAMKKATDEDTTARGLCTDLYNQREAHIESDRKILHNLKPLLQQLNICDGKDGDATDTKRNMFGMCASDPCQNGGVCTDGILSQYTCECVGGFFGANCENSPAVKVIVDLQVDGSSLTIPEWGGQYSKGLVEKEFAYVEDQEITLGKWTSVPPYGSGGSATVMQSSDQGQTWSAIPGVAINKGMGRCNKCCCHEYDARCYSQTLTTKCDGNDHGDRRQPLNDGRKFTPEKGKWYRFLLCGSTCTCAPGYSGVFCDTKSNGDVTDNLLQVAASSTSEMQAKCALAKKSVTALLETSASPQGSYVDFESRVTSEIKFMNEQKLECDASAAAILANATAAAESTKQNARTLASDNYAETTVRLNGERDTYKTEQKAVEERLKKRNDEAARIKGETLSAKETMDEEYRETTSNGVEQMMKAVAGRAEARTAAVELRKHNIVSRTNQLIEDTHLKKMNIDSRSAESKTYCTESLGDLVAESDLVKKINNVFHTGTEDGTGTGGLRVVGDDDLTEEDKDKNSATYGQLKNVKAGINDIEFDKTDAQGEQRLTANDAFGVNELAGLTEAKGTGINSCYRVDCGHGTCSTAADDSYTCTCAEGYSGTHCGTDVDETTGNTYGTAMPSTGVTTGNTYGTAMPSTGVTTGNTYGTAMPSYAEMPDTVDSAAIHFDTSLTAKDTATTIPDESPYKPYLPRYSGLCTDDGRSYIGTAEDCTKGAEVIGWVWQNHIGGEEGLTYPPGCQLHAGDDSNYFFNTNTASTVPCSTANKCLCTSNGNEVLSNEMP